MESYQAVLLHKVSVFYPLFNAHLRYHIKTLYTWRILHFKLESFKIVY